MTQSNDKNNSSLLTDDKTFANVLGQAVWLMSMDSAYKDLPISMIEGRILPPIILRQFKLYSKGKQPVAFLTWAMVEPGMELDREVLSGNDLKIWRSGEEVTVVDCVSPFGSGERVKEIIFKEIADKRR